MAGLEKQINAPGTNPGLAQLRREHERLQLLYHVNSVIHSTLEPDRALQLIIAEAMRLTRASSASVVLLNPTSGFLEIEAAAGLPPDARALRLKVGEGITGWVASTGKTARVGDVSRDPRYVAARRTVRSELAVPLEAAGEIRGVLNVDSDQLDAFSAEDEQLLRDLAVSAAQVIQNTWLYEQLRQKTRLLETLASVSQTINSTLNLDDALDVITREASRLMTAKLSSLLMLDPTGEWLELRSSRGAGEAYLSKPPVPVQESLLGTVVRRKKPLQVENVQLSSLYQNVEVARAEGLVSLLSVPLLDRGRCIGTLSVYTGVPHSFSNEEIRILSALAEFSGIAIEKARLYERLVDIEAQLRQNEKLSAVGLIAAEIAHEIRNPLTVIKMLFHSLDLQFPESDPRARDVQVIRERMEHLNKTVEQILGLARSSDPVLQPIRLNDLIEDLALLVRHKLKNQGVQFALDLDPAIPEVLADSSQLSQALLNLVLNAAEAMPHGGSLKIKTGVITRGRPASKTVFAEFRDTGVGLSEELQAKLFSSAFHTTKKNGTGLGLAIVRRILEAHGGAVSVKSRPGKGAVFRVTLPAANAPTEN